MDTNDTTYTDAHELDLRYELAAHLERASEQHILRLLGPGGDRMSRQRAEMIVKFAARNIRADETNTLTKARALADATNVEFNGDGDPQTFPYDNASTDAVRAAKALDPNDHSAAAEHARELALQVRDHREAYRRGHRGCRGDLYRGYCH